jgi:hypothetical protein
MQSLQPVTVILRTLSIAKGTKDLQLLFGTHDGDISAWPTVRTVPIHWPKLCPVLDYTRLKPTVLMPRFAESCLLDWLMAEKSQWML